MRIVHLPLLSCLPNTAAHVLYVLCLYKWADGNGTQTPVSHFQPFHSQLAPGLANDADCLHSFLSLLPPVSNNPPRPRCLEIVHLHSTYWDCNLCVHHQHFSLFYLFAFAAMCGQYYPALHVSAKKISSTSDREAVLNSLLLVRTINSTCFLSA